MGLLASLLFFLDHSKEGKGGTERGRGVLNVHEGLSLTLNDLNAYGNCE